MTGSPPAIPEWEPPPSSEPERRTLRATADTSKQAVPDPASFTGLLRRIPGLLIRQALFRLPAIALTVVPAWMVHTYLVVFKNEGFNGVQHWAAAYCNVTGNATTAFLSFGLGSAMFWSVLISVLRCGPTATVQTLVGAPGRCLTILSSKDPNSRLGLALGVGLVLMGSNYLGLSYQTRLVFGGATLFLGMGYPGTLLGMVLGELMGTLKARYPWMRSLEVGLLVRSTIASLPVAFLTSWFFSAWTTDKLGMLALLFVGYTLYTHYQKAKGGAVKTPLWLLVGGWWLLEALLGSHPAWADDGGWAEATGDNADLTWANIVQWWNSQGSGQAISQGLVPVVGAGVGAAMIPPIAPPKGGLDYKEDVTQHVTKDDKEFAYGLGIARQGTERLPADGRSEAFGYSVGESNDPQVKPGDIARAAQFTTTAPPGFELSITRVDAAFGGDHKQYTIVAVASPESAFAPGEIPGVVYAEASTPAGIVRGHMRCTILVGTGKLHLEPMERDWLRADGEDHFQLTAYIEPTDRAQITDEERRSTLELATYGPNASWAGVSSPGDGEFYRYWTVQAAKASDPKAMKEAIEVELGLQGRFAGGLFQQKIPIQILPPPRLESVPEVPFLVPDHQEKVEVVIEVVGQAPKEEWELDPPDFRKGDKEAVLLDAEPVKLAPGKFKLTFILGKLDEDKSCAESCWALVAREKKGAETEEFILKVLAARPGVVILSKTPFQVLADGKKEHELKLTVLRWNEQSKKVEVDEAALSTVEFEVVQEGEVSKALEAAELQFKFSDRRGSDLSRHALYSVSSLLPVPGMGLCQGKFDAFLKGETDEAFRRPLPIALALDAVSLEKNKGKEEEWRLILDVLERYFKRPYDKAESSEQSGKLACLIKIYEEWMKQLELEKPGIKADDLRRKRRAILEQAVVTWKAIGEGYLGDANFYQKLYVIAKTADWVSSVLFSACLKASLAWAGPLGSTIGSTFGDKIRAWISKLVGNTVNGIPSSQTYEEIQEDLWGAVRDFTWQDAPELLAKKVFGTPGEGGETEVPFKVKAALIIGFLLYRFYRNYVDPDPSTDQKDVGFVRACELTAWDFGGKKLGDAFENYVKECPIMSRGAGAPKVKDIKSPFGSSPAPAAPPAPSSGDATPAAPPAPSSGDATPAAPPAPSSGDATPAAPPAPSSGDATPAAPPAPSSGDATPAAPPAPSSGDATPAAPPAPSSGDATPAAPPAPSSGDAAPAAPPAAGDSGHAPPPTPPAGPAPAVPHVDSHGVPKIDLS